MKLYLYIMKNKIEYRLRQVYRFVLLHSLVWMYRTVDFCESVRDTYRQLQEDRKKKRGIGQGDIPWHTFVQDETVGEDGQKDSLGFILE